MSIALHVLYLLTSRSQPTRQVLGATLVGDILDLQTMTTRLRLPFLIIFPLCILEIHASLLHYDACKPMLVVKSDFQSEVLKRSVRLPYPLFTIIFSIGRSGRIRTYDLWLMRPARTAISSTVQSMLRH